ncbi:hypothetical protein [Mesorhizobium onobrychidis]|uniref:hypothetical protein n=1 Tax=Mesorhizobium onobrychidis TaxID=2775404 RepID=UPI002157B8F3|nr:hypothetical protein [Mesorhizobium onobrychidis]
MDDIVHRELARESVFKFGDGALQAISLAKPFIALHDYGQSVHPVAELDENPEVGFGAAEQRGGLWIAWSWGTCRMRRCVPGITEFFHAVLGPEVAARGAFRVEARRWPQMEWRCAVSGG